MSLGFPALNNLKYVSTTDFGTVTFAWRGPEPFTKSRTTTATINSMTVSNAMQKQTTTMEMRLVLFISWLILLVSADNPSLLRLKRKTTTTTVAGIESFFNEVDTEHGMLKARNLEQFPWTTKQFSMNTDPPEPRAAPTLAPVPLSEECRNVDRPDVMLEELSVLTPKAELNNLVTPQGMAFHWILNVDEAKINPCMDPTRARQRYALAVMYYSTGGDSWIDNTNWLTGSNSECQWTKVTCHERIMRVSALMMRTFSIFVEGKDLEDVHSHVALRRIHKQLKTTSLVSFHRKFRNSKKWKC